jgi:hypothetical protein
MRNNDLAMPSARAGRAPPRAAARLGHSATITIATASFNVMGETVTTRAIADAIDALANLPLYFRAIELGRSLLPDCGGHQRQEATNRLMQRWRKLGLAAYSSRGWTLTKGSWGALHAQGIEARRAATLGAVHESPVGETDAPEQGATLPPHTGEGRL